MTDKTEFQTGEIRCHSGIFYNYEEPTVDMIRLEDIAHHLSNTCRFSGACDPYYSVAEHSVIVSRLVNKWSHAKAALFHDAAEAYLWDIPRPAKHLYGEVYADLTKLADAVICHRFAIDPAKMHSPEVDEADLIAVNYEGNEVMPEWTYPKPELPLGVLDWRIGLPPEQAKQLFLQECNRVGVSTKVDYAPPLPQREAPGFA